MSSVEAINIANALVSLIDAATLPLDVTVERRWSGPLARETLAAPLVLVVPVAREDEFASRANYGTDWQIALAVYAPVTGVPATASVDALMELAEAVFGVARANETLAPGRLIGLSADPMFDSDAVIGRGMFASIATLTYRSLAV